MEKMKLNIQLFAVTNVYIEIRQISQDITNNSSLVNVSAYATTTGDSHNDYPRTGTYTIDGTNYTFSTTLPRNTKKTLFSQNHTIYHNSDGTKYLTASFSLATGISAGTISANTEINLDTIPRYATINSFSLYKIDERTLGASFTTDVEIDYSQYSFNKTNWRDFSPNETIRDLEPNTEYNVYLRVRRKDSQLWTETDYTVKETTFDYPHLNAINSFNIGEDIFINLYNPLKRTVLLEFYGNGNTRICSAYRNTEGDMTIGNSGDEITTQYASIPNQKSSTFYCNVTYNGITKRSGTAYYYCLENEVNPQVNNAEFKDVREHTINLTDNENIIIKNASIGNVTISFTTRKYAKCKQVIINGNVVEPVEKSVETDKTNYTASTLIYNAQSDTITYSIRDTRDFPTGELTVSATGGLVNYSDLVSTFTFERFSPTSDRMIMNFNMSWWSGNFGKEDNYLGFKWRVREKNSDIFSDYQFPDYDISGEGIIKTITPKDYEKDVKNPLTEDGKWDYQKAYVFETETNDSIHIWTIGEAILSTITVGKGIPVYNWYEKNGINYFNVNGTLTVNNQPVSGSDTVPIDSIFEYDGTSVPEGYERVYDYSTDEIKTGEIWIDGKSIYRKVFTGSMPTILNDWNSIGTIQNVDKVIKASGNLIENNNSYYNLFYYEYCAWYMDKSQSTFNLLPKISWAISYDKTYIIIVEYTKTTD